MAKKKNEIASLIETFPEHKKMCPEAKEKQDHNERVVFESLKKGIYDIDFAIGICQKVIEICDKRKADASYNLAFTLKQSLQQLVSYLQVQKCGVDRDPYVDMFCVNCGAKERVFKGDAEGWKKCKKCLPNKGFK